MVSLIPACIFVFNISLDDIIQLMKEEGMVYIVSGLHCVDKNLLIIYYSNYSLFKYILK